MRAGCASPRRASLREDEASLVWEMPRRHNDSLHGDQRRGLSKWPQAALRGGLGAVPTGMAVEANMPRPRHRGYLRCGWTASQTKARSAALGGSVRSVARQSRQAGTGSSSARTDPRASGTSRSVAAVTERGFRGQRGCSQLPRLRSMRRMCKSGSGCSESLLIAILRFPKPIAFFLVLLLFLSGRVPQIACCTPTTSTGGFLASCSAYAILDVAPAHRRLTTGSPLPLKPEDRPRH